MMAAESIANRAAEAAPTASAAEPGASWLSLLAPFVSALPALAAVLITVFLVHRLARRNAHLSSLQYYNQSSQAVNLEIMKSEDMARWYRDQYHRGFSVNFVRRLYHCFWNIHFIRWTIDARHERVLSVRRLDKRIEARIKRMLERNPDCLGYIFAERAGYYDLSWLDDQLRQIGVDPVALWNAENQARARSEDAKLREIDLREASADPAIQGLLDHGTSK
jgi:hypothetical protein